MENEFEKKILRELDAINKNLTRIAAALEKK